MRPIERGAAPCAYGDYKEAKQDLVNRLGTYCSYCERRIATNLAVEHIQAKSLPHYAHLANDWNNFLLACVNCNSSKSAAEVDPARYLLPDRDNTFAAYRYNDFGEVVVADTISPEIAGMALATCELTALNRCEWPDWDEKVAFSALERVGQRVENWVVANSVRSSYDAHPASIDLIAKLAAASGFFSIWMEAFEGIPEVRQAIILAFPGTATDCFDAQAQAISPRPANGLAHAGKV